ncbi:bifunctional DNA-formamidopyrimidine glycosylase/DNA-(apurinic or apyrimidinic site) lyase [Fastidiosibacter lacustris]|uniref:bifunctional DNA-formamidopyrimidine glycosylase/DNA-(apurinic or apyrimidinic site) lyase n=1 Tax=Fastidiosibacter lacustris TaxID=2056695 RepID=UPI000E356C0B|nr:bifunctional DNA-formamidopyrimidine glycosylase/DNA-(apurinic or apyrimidinic site) lyase [Fastidiosibacter lacustris]
MPELPEVETIKNGLNQYCINKTIVEAGIYCQKLRYPLDPTLCQKLKGQVILNFERRGKHLIVKLANYTLIIHLGMSGSLQIVDTDCYKLQKHNHIVLKLNDNTTLFYHDPRRFGYWHITSDDPLQHRCFNHYGLEPLSDVFTPKYLVNALKSRKQPIKSSIMDNKIVVGIGNIYACESLFLAQLHPQKASNILTIKEHHQLINAIKTTLADAITQGGTTLKDYKNATGKPGYFAQKLKVYGQKDKPCVICHTAIKAITLAQRTTFYCPNCQR